MPGALFEFANVLSAGNHGFINYNMLNLPRPPGACKTTDDAFCIRPRRKAYLVALVQQR